MRTRVSSARVGIVTPPSRALLARSIAVRRGADEASACRAGLRRSSPAGRPAGRRRAAGDALGRRHPNAADARDGAESARPTRPPGPPRCAAWRAHTGAHRPRDAPQDAIPARRAGHAVSRRDKCRRGLPPPQLRHACSGSFQGNKKPVRRSLRTSCVQLRTVAYSCVQLRTGRLYAIACEAHLYADELYALYAGMFLGELYAANMPAYSCVRVQLRTVAYSSAGSKWYLLRPGLDRICASLPWKHVIGSAASVLLGDAAKFDHGLHGR